MLAELAHWGLAKMDPEKAHDWARYGMQRKWFAPGPCSAIKKCGFLPMDLSVSFLGQKIPNVLGLAAGFDKNGELVDVFDRYGFGFMEVGSVTYRGGPGNPKPRMFRVDYPNIMNRMGLNGLPADDVADQLYKFGLARTTYGVNITKTHSPEILGDAAIRDIGAAYQMLRKFGFYTVLNVSCPNTREGRTFEDVGALKELLAAIRGAYELQYTKPLLLKLGPSAWCGLSGLPLPQLDKLLQLGADYDIDGYVCCNTLPFQHPTYGKGGLSGNTVRLRSKFLLRAIRERLGKNVVLIGCGGVFTGDNALELLRAGADVVQAYNGFVRGPNAGPRFAHKVLGELYKLTSE